jgi:hypothetical protein
VYFCQLTLSSLRWDQHLRADRLGYDLRACVNPVSHLLPPALVVVVVTGYWTRYEEFARLYVASDESDRIASPKVWLGSHAASI